MGVAAYNRGTRAIQAALDRQAPPQELVILRDLSAFSAATATRTVFADTVVRFDDTGNAWLMHRPDRGWGEYGVPYPSLWAVARTWRLVFLGFGRDAHSRFVVVAPRPEGVSDGDV